MSTNATVKLAKETAPRVHPMTLGVVRYKFLAVAEEVDEPLREQRAHPKRYAGSGAEQRGAC